ncbi:thiamine-phosphate kinase [Azovibrio restrictus]|uniref:thiamine-phosphate kinase n=1 Tax=Azovibrio restrictus TaxID=146938 RepID=UPI0026EF49ED|nr:thiamine-phosphate kinase [Azovibrio restrictus]
MGEFDLIARYFARSTPGAILGPGDDGALVQPGPGLELAVTTDMLVEGTHFLPGTDPRDLGWKTLAVNLSDLAAMGARPRWGLLALSLPSADEAWLAAFAEGLHACAREFDVDLIGGDTTRGPLNLCVTAIGEVPAGQALRRNGAREGDDIWISGQPGLAALGLAQLQGRLDLPPRWQPLCIKRLQAPRPRVQLGQALRLLAHAAIDVSDGLLADLGHIARSSNLQARLILNQLPHLPAGVDRAAALDALLAGGDDYELCFTAPASQRLALGCLATDLDVPLWRIGRMEAANPLGAVLLMDADGQVIPWDRQGYDHFA